MILVNKAIEPTVASATSTYPAIITVVGEKSEAFIQLGFYCPSIIPGQPYEAVNAALYNSSVTAPVNPHNGADDYDYKVGGVIIVSFENGNLNSPQFVRYVTVKDEVIEQNVAYLKGEKVLPTGIIALDDIDRAPSINAPILKKAASLLEYVRYCAKGSNNNSNIIEFSHVFKEKLLGLPKVVKYFKCGVYGTEIIGSGNFMSSNQKMSLDLEYTGTLTQPSITFLNISSYFYNNVLRPSNTRIVTDFKLTCETKGYTGYNDIAVDEYVAQRLFTNITGLLNTEDSLINSANTAKSEYEELTKAPKGSISSLVSIYDSIYNTNVIDFKNFRNIFWDKFDSSVSYYTELSRAYAIILHNNLFKLKSAWDLSGVDNLVLIIVAVVITAYQLLEQTMLRKPSEIVNMDPFTMDFFSQLEKYSKSVDYRNNVTFLTSKANYFANRFTELYFYLLGLSNESSDEITSVKTTIKSNIEIGIRRILDNASTILNLMAQELTDSSTTVRVAPSTATETTSKSKGLINNYTWPLLQYTRVTSPYGYRATFNRFGKLDGGSKLHNGIDIGAKIGSDVVAVEDGVVDHFYGSNTDKTNYGLHLYINHAGNYQSFYAHLDQVLVKKGQTVKKGQIIAKSGNSGFSTGPHLHFGIRTTKKAWADSWIDPMLPGN